MYKYRYIIYIYDIWGEIVMMRIPSSQPHCGPAHLWEPVPKSVKVRSLGILNGHRLPDQWPFQEPKLEVPTIYKAYVREYPHKIWPYMVQYLHFRILEFPLIYILIIYIYII
jgi:hypothetical protein